ncbi:MAG: TonB-dependent receptor [Oligoflexia bacterium]|nr:TonB-dependent receptor [Oligoflexia bacterium]
MRILFLQLLCAACLLLPTVSAYSQVSAPSRTVVVSASRAEEELAQVGSSVSVITAQEIEARGFPTVADVLESIAGVEVVRSGPLGGNAAVFMRGANSEHTLVLIDGMEANDPISPNRAFNFADLQSDNIERIEILRGPQSTLYGSDALGGVISIFTKTGSGAPSAKVSFEGGSYDTFTERAALAGGDRALNYSLGIQQLNSGGISSASNRDGNSEADAYSNTSLSGKLGGWFNKNLGAVASVRYLHGRADLDNYGGVGGDDPNRELVRDQLFTRVEIKTDLLDSRLKQTFGVGVSSQSFDDDNDPDSTHVGEVLRSQFNSRLTKFDFQNDVTISDLLRLVVGAESEEERGDSSYFSDGMFGPFSNDLEQHSVRTNSLFLDSRLGGESGPAANAGVRYDHHETFGSKVSWRFVPFYRFADSGTKLFSSIGTGFKAPSLFQLYSSYGNENLSAEKSLGLDAGVDQQLFDGALNVGVAYFWNRFNDLISFNPQTFISENIARARTQGVEASAAWNVSTSAQVKVSYTYTDTQDRDSGESLLRRPRNKLHTELQLQATPKLHLRASMDIVGRRFDNDFSTFPATRTRMGSYTLVGFGASYQIDPRFEIFSRVENAFDREYEQVLGFGEPGLAAYGGLRVKL